MRIDSLTHEVLLTEDEYFRLLTREPASEELEEEVITYMAKFNGDNFHKAPWAIDSTGMRLPIELAKFGANWQKEQILKKIEQKSAWSEIDFSILDSIICVVEEWENNQSEEEKEYYGASTKFDWLKSLKERLKGE